MLIIIEVLTRVNTPLKHFYVYAIRMAEVCGKPWRLTVAKAQKDVLDEAREAFALLDVKDMQEYIASLEALAAEKKQARVDALMAELKALGVSQPAPSKPRAVRAQGERASPRVKYRDPVSGAEWSGRGRAANWIVAYEAEGRSRDEFLIE